MRQKSGGETEGNAGIVGIAFAQVFHDCHVNGPVELNAHITIGTPFHRPHQAVEAMGDQASLLQRRVDRIQCPNR